jgi:hypothetical protein
LVGATSGAMKKKFAAKKLSESIKKDFLEDSSISNH